MTKYYVDGNPVYLHNGNQLTQEEVDRLKSDRIEKDRKAGYRDRIAGFYDEWYKFNREDQGAAYEEGVKEAKNNPYCSKRCYTLPCI